MRSPMFHRIQASRKLLMSHVTDGDDPLLPSKQQLLSAVEMNRGKTPGGSFTSYEIRHTYLILM